MIPPEHATTEVLFVNLEDRGLLQVNELEARLVKVEIQNCDCRKTSGPRGSATIQIDVRSPLGGLMRTSTQNLRFRQVEGGKPWGATVDLSRRPIVPSPITEPEDVGRLLATFL